MLFRIPKSLNFFKKILKQDKINSLKRQVLGMLFGFEH